MPPVSGMGQVTVTLNGRTFKLTCADGEEAHVLQLAGMVGRRVQAVVEEFGLMSDDQVLLLASIMLADELLAARLPGGPRPEITTPHDGLAQRAPGKAWR